MNIEALLEPVEGDGPCGDDLSFSRAFDAVQESRRADDPTLAQGDWTRPLKSADWHGVGVQTSRAPSAATATTAATPSSGQSMASTPTRHTTASATRPAALQAGTGSRRRALEPCGASVP